jgi:hypothetical protein
VKDGGEERERDKVRQFRCGPNKSIYQSASMNTAVSSDSTLVARTPMLPKGATWRATASIVVVIVVVSPQPGTRSGERGTHKRHWMMV